METTFADALAWYLKLARMPAFKAHAWHTVNELARSHPVLFRDLPEQLTREMRKGEGADV